MLMAYCIQRGPERADTEDAMNTITGTIQNGHVVLDATPAWPEGSRVVVEPLPFPEITGMTEEEQGDDPESIARWIAAFDAIPPLVMDPREEAEWLAWRQKVKEYNIEAVRRQMEEGIL